MRWTLPNILTLARICLTPVLALLPFIQGYWPKVIAFLIFLAASASDVVDGYLARRRNQVSELGQLLDPIADKLLLFATLIPIFWLTRHPTILVDYRIPWWGSLPVWVALLLVGRELLITAFRFFARRRGVVIPALGAGKLKAVVQNVFTGATLFWFAWKDALAAHPWAGWFRNFWDKFHGAGERHRVFAGRVPVSLPPAPQGRVKLEVLTIGTELLLGYTVDTNAAELGRALAAAGAEITRRTTVADRPDAIRAAVAEALDRSRFVITTGGLGPTRDDMTKTVVAQLLGKRLLLDERLLASIKARFDRMGRPMPAVNRTQAEVPEGAVILPNPRGTAPGLWVEDPGGRVVVLLPGVPREMHGLLVEEVLPRIVARQGGSRRVVLSRTVRTSGVSESALAERVGPIEPEIAPLTLAYLPSVDGVDLRVTAWELEPEDAQTRLAVVVERLKAAVGEHGYGEDGADLAAVLLDVLRKGRHRLGVAESCTGGMVGERITNIPGASDTFIGGVVAYADVIKTAALKVPLETLEAYGAVSEATVRAMAEGAQRLFSADCTIAVTGIAGPGGGTPEKPVGTVWLAARKHTTTRVLTRVLPGERDDVRRRAAQAGLDLLRRLLAET